MGQSRQHWQEKDGASPQGQDEDVGGGGGGGLLGGLFGLFGGGGGGQGGDPGGEQGGGQGSGPALPWQPFANLFGGDGSASGAGGVDGAGAASFGWWDQPGPGATLGQPRGPVANSPLVEHLWGMDPIEALTSSGLPEDRLAEASRMLANKELTSWTDIKAAFGDDVGQALLNNSANHYASQHLDQNGLTTLYTENLPHYLGPQPDTSGIVNSLDKNLGNSVTKLFNPTVDEIASMYATNKVSDAYMAMHGLPGQSMLRLGDSQKYGFQPASTISGPAGQSANLQSMLPINCYADMGGEFSLTGQLKRAGITTLGANPYLKVSEANQLVETASSLQAQGVSPADRFRAAGQQWAGDAKSQSRFRLDLDMGAKGWGAATTYEDALNGKSIYGSDPALVKSAVQAELPGSLWHEAGNVDANAALFKDYFRNFNLSLNEPSPRDLAARAKAPGLAAPGASGAPKGSLPGGAADPSFSLPETGPAKPGFNLGGFLEGGMATLGMIGGGAQALGGLGELTGALSGEKDARAGVSGASNLLAGGVNLLQGGAQLAGNIPGLGGLTKAVPGVSVLARNTHLGMLSALPAVTNWGYDVLSGASGAQTAVDGGVAQEALGTAALATYGGPVGMSIALGDALGTLGYQALADQHEGNPRSMGEMLGMWQHCVGTVGAQQANEDLIFAAAGDSRAYDPNASGIDQIAGRFNQSWGQMALIGDLGWNSLLGQGDQSMLMRAHARDEAAKAAQQGETAQEAEPSIDNPAHPVGGDEVMTPY